MRDSIEFSEQEDCIYITCEDDRPPFNEFIMGSLRLDEDGYYRFHAARRAVATVRQLRIIMNKMSELNTKQTQDKTC